MSKIKQPAKVNITPNQATKPVIADNYEAILRDIAPDNSNNNFINTITKGWVPYIIIALLGLGIYANTFKHELALDDDIVVCKNEFVLQGVTGMADIFKYDMFESFYRAMNTTAQLSGGRYRPFSVATFAIEQELIGTMAIPDSVKKLGSEAERALAMKPVIANYLANSWDINKNGKGDPNEDINKDGLYNDKDVRIKGMGLRHVNNVLMYILSVCFLFMFLSSYIFKNNKWLALLISLMFVAHPIHTEVVANVKSRDEILSLMFMILTMHFSFKFLESKKYLHVILSGLFLFLGLLSKEYGFTLLAIIPIGAYALYQKMPWGNSGNITKVILVCIGLLVVYALLNSYIAGLKDECDAERIAFVNKYSSFMLSTFLVSLVIFVPLYFYIIKPEGVLGLMPVLLFTFMLFFTIRNCVVLAKKSDLQATELLNNPYLLADEDQVWPTKLSANYNYAKLLLAPFNLSCDYSYRVLPYQNMDSPKVLVSILLLLIGFVSFIYTSIKRNWLAIPIGFVMLHLILVNNILIDIGATMGERLVYHTSLGTIILVCYGVWYLFNKYLKANAQLYAIPLLLIIGLYAAKTVARNPAWKNDIALHLTDVKTYPESTMLNGNACTRLIELSEMPANKDMANKLLDSAKQFGAKSLKLHDKFVNSFLNMGIIMARQNNMDSAAYFWGLVRKQYPHHPQLPLIDQNLTSSFYARSMEFANKKDFTNAVIELQKAMKYTPENPKLLYDIGGMLYNGGRYAEAKPYWDKAIQLSPGDANTLNGLNALAKMGIK
jgi:protein O-mannosyl-transferase